MLKRLKSIPKLLEAVVSHSKSGFAILAARTPVPQLVAVAFNAIVYLLFGTAWLPTSPHPARNFKLLITSLSFKKFSSEAFQANAAEGKVPHLLPSANLEEPSLRTVAVSKYLSSKL